MASSDMCGRNDLPAPTGRERYRQEVLSGSLEWSAAHTDEGFWRECAPRLTDNNCQLLRVLTKLLEASRESRTLAAGPLICVTTLQLST